VVVNGRAVDYLESHAGRAAGGPCRVAVTLPPGSLHAGENVLQLRVTPDPETGRRGPIGVSRLTLEIPD
jgi:hypothetical protein